MAGDPQTYALAALFSFQGATIAREPATTPPTLRPGCRSGHDGYHIAAIWGCQGRLDEGLARPISAHPRLAPGDLPYQYNAQTGPKVAGATNRGSEVPSMLIDHVDLRVSSFAKVRPLYDALLPAMGFSEIGEDEETISYYRPGGRRTAPFFGINVDPSHRPNGSRIALYAASRDEVDRLSAIAKSAAATAFEPPALIEEYSPFYYASFFEDADGNKLEICFREPPK